MLINQSLAAMCKFIPSQEIFFVLGLVLQSVYNYVICPMQMFSFFATPYYYGHSWSRGFNDDKIQIYYINTNEIPGELSCKNMISSHMKITCYLHM